ARVTPAPPVVSPMPTNPASVSSCTTLRKKYGPWQPPTLRSGGSGSAIGVTVSLVIFSGAGRLEAGAATTGRGHRPTALPAAPATADRNRLRREICITGSIARRRLAGLLGCFGGACPRFAALVTAGPIDHHRILADRNHLVEGLVEFGLVR